MIKQSSKFTAAEFFYAIDFDRPSTFEHSVGSHSGHAYEYVHVVYPSIWFKRKKGQITVVKGGLSHFTKGKDFSAAGVLEDAMSNFDGRYGGDAQFRWDGVNMWAPQQEFAAVAAVQAELDNYLKTFPAIPAGYTGWFSIKS